MNREGLRLTGTETKIRRGVKRGDRGESRADERVNKRKHAALKHGKSNILLGEGSADQTLDQVVARALADGVVANTATAIAFSKRMLPELDLTESVKAIRSETRRVQGGDLTGLEAMLTSQAIALNAIFTHLARMTSGWDQMDHIDRFMRLAFKAQSQCRATLETLALIRNPPVFARQANIAQGPQQVNNGSAASPIQPKSPGPTRAGRLESSPIKLLEATRERMDSREASTAGEGDSALASLGALNRAKNG